MKRIVVSTIIAVLGFAASASAAEQDATSPTPAAPAQEAQAPVTQEAAPAVESAKPADEPAKPAEAEAAPEAKSKHGSSRGIELPYGIRLNGKFDVAYERTGFSSNLQDGKNELKNYHHFLFLSRQVKDDPFFFNGELIERYFYEFGFREKIKATPLSFNARAGKVLVPFGGEPLFHHAYGGLTGFDQPVLPVVWSQLGAAGNVQYRGNGWRLTDDVYAVQGYGLENTDAVINLQSGFSDNERLKAAFGNRLGFGMGPVSVYYSTYYNNLGFKRRLVMQAVDAELYRLDNLPVLKDTVLGLGFMRADVTGGGAGKDYYHFADYVLIRYYIYEGLSAEGRAGLRTFNNRDGTYIDNSRLDEKDASAGTLTLAYRRGGLSVAVQQIWNFEKKNEFANDVFRVRTGYDF